MYIYAWHVSPTVKLQYIPSHNWQTVVLCLVYCQYLTDLVEYVWTVSAYFPGLIHWHWDQAYHCFATNPITLNDMGKIIQCQTIAKCKETEIMSTIVQLHWAKKIMYHIFLIRIPLQMSRSNLHLQYNLSVSNRECFKVKKSCGFKMKHVQYQ